MIRKLAVKWFRYRGWKSFGALPKMEPYSLFVFAPNHGIMDFFIGIALSEITGFKTRFYVNKKYFVLGFGQVLKGLGASPFDSKNYSPMEQGICFEIESRRKFSAVIPFQKSRNNKTDFWNGFHDISRKLRVPIVLVTINHNQKVVKFHSKFYASSSIERDVRFAQNQFSSIRGVGENMQIPRSR